ncbi:MAG: hypothetical protein ACOCWG_01400 [bacterium]
MNNLTHQDLWALFKGEVFCSENYKPIPNFNPTKASVSNYIAKQGFKPVYPQDKKFAVILSHDIDFLKPPLSAYISLKKALKFIVLLKIKKGFSYISNYLKYQKANNYSLYPLISFLNDNFLKTTFFFFALNEKDRDFQYYLEEYVDLIYSLKAKGHEIGLHGSIGAHDSFTEIEKQRNKFKTVLGFNPIGYRNHCLKHDSEKSFNILSKGNFSYDATLGFRNFVGFRNGMSYPYNPYCEETQCFLDITEMPLNIMDVAYSKHMKYSHANMVKSAVSIIDEVINNRGVLSILWHHNDFNREKRETLSYLIKYIRSKGGWITNHIDLMHHWSEKEFNKEINKKIIEIKKKVH